MLNAELSTDGRVLLSDDIKFAEISTDRNTILSVRDSIDKKLEDIRQGLEIFGYRQYDIVLSGSLVCGHYDKPKPRDHSLNPSCPINFSEVIEADVRIIMPECVDILNPRITKELVLSANGKDTFTGRIQRFNQEIDMVRTYDYEHIHNGTGLEFEVCYNRHPYYEISRVWRNVFTPDEIEWQKRVREVARHTLHSDYETDYSELKACQTRECRYRICANYFLQKQKLSTDDFVPIEYCVPEWLKPAVDNWDKRNDLVGTKRPDRNIPEIIEHGMIDSGLLSLTEPPVEPDWLKLANSMKR